MATVETVPDPNGLANVRVFPCRVTAPAVSRRARSAPPVSWTRSKTSFVPIEAVAPKELPPWTKLLAAWAKKLESRPSSVSALSAYPEARTRVRGDRTSNAPSAPAAPLPTAISVKTTALFAKSPAGAVRETA